MVIAAASTAVPPGTNIVKMRVSSANDVSSRQRTASPFEFFDSIHMVRVEVFGSQVPSEIQNAGDIESAHRRRNFPAAASQVKSACPSNGSPAIWLRNRPVTQRPSPAVELTSMPLRTCGGCPGGPTTCMVASQAPTKRRITSDAVAGGPAGAGEAALDVGGASVARAASATGAKTGRWDILGDLLSTMRPDLSGGCDRYGTIRAP